MVVVQPHGHSPRRFAKLYSAYSQRWNHDSLELSGNQDGQDLLEYCYSYKGKRATKACVETACMLSARRTRASSPPIRCQFEMTAPCFSRSSDHFPLPTPVIPRLPLPSLSSAPSPPALELEPAQPQRPRLSELAPAVVPDALLQQLPAVQHAPVPLACLRAIRSREQSLFKEEHECTRQ